MAGRIETIRLEAVTRLALLHRKATMVALVLLPGLPTAVVVAVQVL